MILADWTKFRRIGWNWLSESVSCTGKWVGGDIKRTCGPDGGKKSNIEFCHCTDGLVSSWSVSRTSYYFLNFATWFCLPTFVKPSVRPGDTRMAQGLLLGSTVGRWHLCQSLWGWGTHPANMWINDWSVWIMGVPKFVPMSISTALVVWGRGTRHPRIVSQALADLETTETARKLSREL